VKGVRKFMPENRLAKAMQDPNGLLLGHALQKAGANLEKVRDSHMDVLDQKLKQLAAVSGAASPTDADAAELYRIAREIRADSAMFGLKDLARAAHSLCELMSSNRPPTQLWGGAVVHVHAITALRQPMKGAASSREAMLAGLEQISRSAVEQAQSGSGQAK
jgi:hypothetical protein